MYMHNFLLLGRSVQDAETLKTKKDKVFAKFSVAVNEYMGKDKEERAYFYDVLVFGKTAAKAVEHIKKGDIVFIQGRPDADAYISKKDKEAKGKITVLANDWKVIK